MTKDEALKLALDFIERVNQDGWLLADFEPEMYAAITAIKESLKQSEQEPVAWLVTYGGLTHIAYTQPNMVVDTHYQPLYAAPPRREWVGLTDMEVQNIVYCRSPNIANLRKAEQLLKDKNT